MKKLNQCLFFGLLAMFGVTFFTRNDIRTVRDIAPEVLRPPRQASLAGQEVIRFTRNDYAYELTPVAAYEISGLITSRINYAIFTIYKSEKTFPVDLCLIWGSNVSGGVFRDRGVHFSQDCRFCWVRWDGKQEFNLQEFSNNHLLAGDPRLEQRIKGFHPGDQVRIRGKLVNVRARLLGKRGTYDSPEIIWNTSLERTDGGAGACEVIYVEDAEILKEANRLPHSLFRISFYGLIFWIVGSILRFVIEMVRLSKVPVSD